MEEKEKLAIAQDWILKLANGVNPLNGNTVNEDDVVNNVHISRCLFYVADLLGKYAERRVRSVKNIPFDISALQIEKYNYVEAISISAFARELQALLPENMQSVRYSTITKWLLQEGFLVDSAPDAEGHTTKLATPRGNNIGIYSEERESNGRRYMATFYNRDAQKFIIEHLYEISNTQ